MSNKTLETAILEAASDLYGNTDVPHPGGLHKAAVLAKTHFSNGATWLSENLHLLSPSDVAKIECVSELRADNEGLKITLKALQSNYDAFELVYKDKTIEMNELEIELQSKTLKLTELEEQAQALVSALKIARRDERERIFEDAGSPGFDGPMTIETKYDEALEAYEAWKAKNG